MITLAITDDDKLVAKLLGQYLQTQPGIRVLFTAGNGRELLAILAQGEHMPDVLLLDLKMKDMDGIEVLAEVRKNHPAIRVLIITSHYQSSFTGFMVKAGAAAFLPKDLSPDRLPAILQTIHEKGYYFLPEQVDVLRGQISSKAPKPVTETENSLSPRETEVLRLLCQQKTAKEIGEILFVTPRTVEGHKNNLFAKTGVKNLAGLIIYAIRRGIIGIDELPLV